MHIVRDRQTDRQCDWCQKLMILRGQYDGLKNLLGKCRQRWKYAWWSCQQLVIDAEYQPGWHCTMTYSLYQWSQPLSTTRLLSVAQCSSGGDSPVRRSVCCAVMAAARRMYLRRCRGRLVGRLGMAYDYTGTALDAIVPVCSRHWHHHHHHLQSEPKSKTAYFCITTR